MIGRHALDRTRMVSQGLSRVGGQELFRRRSLLLSLGGEIISSM